MSNDKNDETPRPYPPVKGERPGKGVLVSDETLRRIQESGRRVEDAPKGPVKSA